MAKIGKQQVLRKVHWILATFVFTPTTTVFFMPICLLLLGVPCPLYEVLSSSHMCDLQ